MNNVSDILKSPLRKLGITKSSGVVRLLRDTQTFVPLLMLYKGFPKEDRRRWHEYQAFRSKYGTLLTLDELGADRACRVMFVHLSSSIVFTLIEGMLAKSLQLRDCRPFFVTHRMRVWPEEYLRVFGYRDFVYIEDYLPDAAEYDRLAAQLLSECSTLQDILKFQFKDADVGRHALSTALANLRRGTVDLAEPAIKEKLRRALALSMRNIVAAEQIIDLVRPEKLFVFERGYSPWAEFYEVSLQRAVETINWYWSHRDDSLVFRRCQYDDRYLHYLSLADKTWQTVQQMPWTPEDGEALKESLIASYLPGPQLNPRNLLRGQTVKTPQQLRKELNLDPAKPNAFIFSHILWDGAFWDGDNLFGDFGTWLVETIRAACRNPNLNWVIKMHPDNVWKSGSDYALDELDEYTLIRKHFPELPGHVALMPPDNDTSMASLFGFVDYAVTVRGTVGLEFPCFGTPTLTAGTGRYSGRGFTYDSATREEYLRKLEHLQDIPPLDERQTALAQRFSHAVFKLKPLPIKSFAWPRFQERIGAASPSEFTINLSSPAELETAEDLSLFADWTLNSTKRDLMVTY